VKILAIDFAKVRSQLAFIETPVSKTLLFFNKVIN